MHQPTANKFKGILLFSFLFVFLYSYASHPNFKEKEERHKQTERTVVNVLLTPPPTPCLKDFISYPGNLIYCQSDTSLKELSHSVDTTGFNGYYTVSPSSGLDFNYSTGAFRASTSQKGTYTINYHYTIPGCVPFASGQTITILPSPSIEINKGDTLLSVCEGEEISLTVENLDGKISSCKWSSSSYNGADTTFSVSDVSTNDAGWYHVKVQGASACLTSDSIRVEVNVTKAKILSDTNSYCEGQTMKLTGSGGTSYNWSLPNGTTSSNTEYKVNHFSIADTGTYILTAVNNTCKDKDTIQITLGHLKGLMIQASAGKVCVGESIVLVGKGADAYSWEGPNNYSSTGEKIIIQGMNNEKSGQYILTATNAAGCTDKDTIQIGIGITGNCINVPELITPNGDNKNDTWFITGIKGHPNAVVMIFNRWGNLVYQASPYKNDWYGQVNRGLAAGKGKLPNGTYFYVIKLPDQDNRVIKGPIELEY